MDDRDMIQPDGEARLPVRRSLAMRRWQRKRAICRKRRIVMHVYSEDFVAGMTAKFCGRLAKRKIHCSCSMCSRKSRLCLTMQARRQGDAFRFQLRDLDM